MWYPEYIKLKNWLSFREEHYIFVNNIPFLITGINNSDDNAESNGSGKSALEEAMNYILLGNSIRKVKDNELITTGDEFCEIEAGFVNSGSKVQLRIVRSLFLKKSSKLEVFLNGKPQSFASINAGNDLILSIIGISREDVQNYYLINKEKYVSFFSSSDSDKKDLIARFSNVDKLDGIEKLIDKDIADEQKVLDGHNINVVSFNSKIDVYKEDLLNVDNTFKSEQEEKIKQINESIDNCKAVIIKSNTEIERKQSYILSINDIIKTYKHGMQVTLKNIENLKDIKYDEELERIRTESHKLDESNVKLRQQKNTLFNSISDYNDLMGEIKKNLSSSVSCPKCKFQFLPGDSKIDINESKKNIPVIEQALGEISKEIEKVGTEMSSINTKINKLDTERKSYEEELMKFRKMKKDLECQVTKYEQDIATQELIIRKTENDISFLKQNIDNANKQIESFQKSITDVKKSNSNARKTELEAKIKEVEVEIIKKSNLIEVQDETIMNLKQWQGLFKRFYSHLTNQSLSIIQGYSNMYLGKMGTNLQIRLEGYKVLSDGRLKENITAQVLRNGIDAGSFNKLSGGEKARIEFSVILAIQSLINSTSKTGGLNICWVDEILESVDGLGIRSLIKSLSNIKKSVFITTHVAHDSTKTDCIVIVKENGVSRILKY